MESDILAAIVHNYHFIVPEMILGAAACVLFVGGTFLSNRHVWAGVSLGALVLAGVAHFLTLSDHFPQGALVPGAVARAGLFNGPLTHDALAALVRLIALGGGIVLVLFSWDEVHDRQAADYYACLLLIVAGLALTGAANELVTLFLALEVISIPTYILLYLPRHDSASQEAALKYFLLSIFSSALLLFGFSYLYGLAGTTNLPTLFDTLHQTGARDLPVVAQVAVIMVVAGLGFRITAVPFHFYAPDVFQGAPTVAAAMLAFVPKVAGFAALVRVLGFVVAVAPVAVDPAFPGVQVPAEHITDNPGFAGMALSTQVPILLWFLAVVTMFLGNILALLQDNLKRLLAYSSVAHAGYMLVSLAAAPYLHGTRTAAGSAGMDGVEALLFYLVAYGAMTVGAFAVLAYLHSPQRPVDTVDDLAGLSRSHPGVALLMTVFLFSLIGIPLTAGFTGKLWIFLGAMSVPSPEHAMLFRVLAVLGMVNAAIGAWYYLRVIAVMYLRTPLRPLESKRRLPGLATLLICAALTVGLSVPPGAQWLLQAARDAAGPRPAVAVRE